MDIRNNHLVADLDSLPEAMRENYRPVPPHLQDQARHELAGRSETSVSFHAAGPLSDWARKERNKAKAKRKQAKASRRRNR
jgi:hypothetical protein